MSWEYLKGIEVLSLVILVNVAFAVPIAIARNWSDFDQSNLISITYCFSEPRIEKSGLANQSIPYVSVSMDGLCKSVNEGSPILPFKTAKILLPYGTRLERVSVVSGNRMLVSGRFSVEFGREPVVLSGVEPEQPSSRNETIYGSDEPFPNRLYSDVSVQSKMGYKLLIVNLHPIEYIPQSGRLFFYDRMRLDVEVSADNTIGSSSFCGYSHQYETVKSIVDNPEAIGGYPKTENTSLYEYVIITNDELNRTPGPYNLQALRDNKISRGITAKIVTVEWIYGRFDGTRPDGGVDNQTKIRNFIIDACNNWGTLYVLLAGDGDGGANGNAIVPHRGFASISGEIDYDIPADMYYACLDGTFDSNRNGIYAEPDDGQDIGGLDLFAEVYVGRACVDSQLEAQNFVRKTLCYENASGFGLRKVWMVGEYLGFGGVSEWGGNIKDETKEGSSAHGYTTVGFEDSSYNCRFDVFTLYDRDYPGNNWQKDEIIDIINNGVHLINHLGHANVGYVMKMSNPDVEMSLNNEELYFIGYSQGCYCGAFDNRTTDLETFAAYDCISEELTTCAHGAVAFVSNSRYGWGASNSTDGASQHYDREFWDAVLGESIFNIGIALQDSKEDNAGRVSSWVDRYCYYEINLFGDPELKIKLPPAYEHELAVNVETPPCLPPGHSLFINATVRNRGLSNENGVKLSILINGTVVKNVTIPELVSRMSYTISHAWTPAAEAAYNVTACVSPVEGETVVANNVATGMVYVFRVRVALISDNSELREVAPILYSMGIGCDLYENNLQQFYSGDLNLLSNYPTVIFNKHDRRLTENERSALESYLCAGGSLLVTGYDSLGHPDDWLLADIVHSSSCGDDTGQPDLYVTDEAHPIMNGPYGNFLAGFHVSGLHSDCDRAEADRDRNAVTVAELGDGCDKIIATEGLPGKVVYWNGEGTADWSGDNDCKAMLRNTVTWLSKPDFEISVTPPYQSIYPGQSTTYEINISETGDQESDVILSLSGLPAGANYTFKRMPNDPDGSTRYALEISTLKLVLPATYDLTVIGSTNETVHLAIVSLTINALIDDPQLVIQVDAGEICFRGELAQFSALTSFKGKLVNATITRVFLLKPNGRTENDLQVQLEETGIYKITWAIPEDADAGTYTLVIEATWHEIPFEVNGTSLKCFQVSPTLTNMEASIAQVKGETATIQTTLRMIIINLTALDAKLESLNEAYAWIRTNLGLIKADIQAINATIISLNDKTADIGTAIGTFQVELEAIQLKVEVIDETTATIKTTLGTIQGKITSIDDGVATIETQVGTVRVAIEANNADKTREMSLVLFTTAISVLALMVIGRSQLRNRESKHDKQNQNAHA